MDKKEKMFRMLSTMNGELEECLNERPETIQPGEYLNTSPLTWIIDYFSGGGVEGSGLEPSFLVQRGTTVP